jgi:2-polyprenyl-6-methoxyphenol hydroxylase-like FAD-dependent oxidoreductase
VHAIVVGAGLVGSMCALALARAGFVVNVIDRDPGPSSANEWQRRGVMQFHQPHVFRKIFHQFLGESAPDVWEALLEAGCIPAPMPDQQGGALALQARRETVERVLREKLATEPGVTMIVGHADRISVLDKRVEGVIVDGAVVASDLVVVATGRASHLGDGFRPAGVVVGCGVSYVSRSYRAVAGTTVPISPWPFAAQGVGYFTAMFPQDDDRFTLLILRPTTDAAFGRLRDGEVFERFASAVPNLAPWVDPTKYVATSDPLPGPELSNSYRAQAVVDGDATAAGLFFVGDAVMATNPLMGRGTATGALQVAELVRLLESSGDLGTAVVAFNKFCEREMRPWFLDHVASDANFLAELTGAERTIDGPGTSDFVVAAAMTELPEATTTVFAYLDMDVPPSSLDPFRDTVGELLRSGWRPQAGTGPTRDDLVALMEAAPSDQL